MMKLVTLIGPFLVQPGGDDDDAGEAVLRHPYQCPLTVSDAEAQRLADAGVLAEPPMAPDAPGAPPAAIVLPGDGEA